jgi:L-threonylcarbamoyladenylate synthase
MSPVQPTRENLALAASHILGGALTVLPTETVYGLAANAMSPTAVEKIFQLKGRPADNPLIVHIASLKQMELFVEAIPKEVHKLAEAFMPGPLTIVLPKLPHISDVLTGGLNTVAIRMPDHPACLAVMELGDLALAMPSANPFMAISPTSAQMIDSTISNGVAMIIDGGPCPIGIESTVLDLTGEPTILRPGSVLREDIELVLSKVVRDGGTGRKSPGMYQRHYAPRTSCTVTSKLSDSQPGLVLEAPANQLQIHMPLEPVSYARQLYASMAEMDSLGLEEFFIQAPPMNVHWVAIWDRLAKATS